MAKNANQPALNVHDVSKSFGQFHALQSIHCHAPKGGITGLIGLNGAGKTTLLKIILGLLKADTGTIGLMGNNAAQPASREPLFYLPEKLSPSPHLTGHEFLSLTLIAYGQNYNKAQGNTLASELLMPDGCLQRRIKTYSKGMTQKISLLAGILSKRSLWILDEPMSGLDPQARHQLKQQLLKLNAQKTSIIFSSHILSDVASLCDWLLVMHQGQLIYQGDVQTFYQAHDDLESAFLEKIAA